MNSILPVNSSYHNNPSWAVENKRKGKLAAICSIGSTAIGCTKTFLEEESFLNKSLGFAQKVLDAVRNRKQYFLYFRNDDDLGLDKEIRPIAAKVGWVGCFIEKYINPIGEPVSCFFGDKVKESYSFIAHWLSTFWWRFRLCFEKIDWNGLKWIPTYLKMLKKNNVEQRKRAQQEIKDLIAAPLGLVGSFFTGIFIPIRAWNKFKGVENKWIDALADSGNLSQHANYIFRFTLEELFKAQETNNKNSWFLFGIGIASNVMNTGLPIIDILPLNEKIKIFWKELAQGLNRTFFSFRRHTKGKEWLAANVDK